MWLNECFEEMSSNSLRQVEDVLYGGTFDVDEFFHMLIMLLKKKFVVNLAAKKLKTINYLDLTRLNSNCF